MKAVQAWLIKALATCGFLTYLPARVTWGKKGYTGAGFIGSLAGLATCSLLKTDPFRCTLILIGGICLSVVVSDAAEKLLGQIDDPRIVIDEWIGLWFAVSYLPQSPFVLMAGFVLFRIFDSLKPGWISNVAELPGGWGIVLDDVLAGLAANACLQIVTRLI